MPIIKSAIKRMKQTAKRRERNVGIKRDIKSAVKAFMAKPSQEALSAAHSEIDTAVKKKLIKKTTAARRKAGLSKVAKASGVKPSASAKAKTATKPAAKKPAATKTTTKAVATKKPTAKTATKKPAAKKSAKKQIHFC
jgi:ribosomal protein S20